MKIIYSKNNTKIIDSYKIEGKEINNIVDKIIKKRKEKGLPVTRTKISYIQEIKAHNRLYTLGILRRHTKDADLEEPISNNKKLVYQILGK